MSQKILAIDDSLTFRKFIGKALAQTPGRYSVSLAKDGEEGLKMAAAERPELILLDYVMPDLSGEEVCAKLAGISSVAGVPIVLMSSSVEAIEDTASRYSSVRGTVAKPFTPELLCDTVEGILAHTNNGMVLSPQVGGNGNFAGNTGAFSLMNALMAVQRARLNGVLEITASGKTISLGCRAGLPVGILNGATWTKPAQAMKNFSQLWTVMDVRFSFDDSAALPDAAPPGQALEGMLEWAMESLRLVKDEAESSYAWGDSTGVPAYNRVGYERVQRIALTQEEIDFVKQVDARSSAMAIGERLGWPISTVHQVLFRFLCLEVLDFWPASILAANR